MPDLPVGFLFPRPLQGTLKTPNQAGKETYGGEGKEREGGREGEREGEREKVSLGTKVRKERNKGSTEVLRGHTLA